MSRSLANAEPSFLHSDRQVGPCRAADRPVPARRGSRRDPAGRRDRRRAGLGELAVAGGLRSSVVDPDPDRDRLVSCSTRTWSMSSTIC